MKAPPAKKSAASANTTQLLSPPPTADPAITSDANLMGVSFDILTRSKCPTNPATVLGRRRGGISD